MALPEKPTIDFNRHIHVAAKRGRYSARHQVGAASDLRTTCRGDRAHARQDRPLGPRWPSSRATSSTGPRVNLNPLHRAGVEPYARFHAKGRCAQPDSRLRALSSHGRRRRQVNPSARDQRRRATRSHSATTLVRVTLSENWRLS